MNHEFRGRLAPAFGILVGLYLLTRGMTGLNGTLFTWGFLLLLGACVIQVVRPNRSLWGCLAFSGFLFLIMFVSPATDVSPRDRAIALAVVVTFGGLLLIGRPAALRRATSMPRAADS